MTAELSQGGSFAEGGIFARHHLHVAEDSGPAGSAVALVGLIDLLASGAIETRSLARFAVQQLRRMRDASHRAPVDEALAARPRETVGAVANVGTETIAASGSIEARLRVALVDAELAVGSRVAGRADAGVVVDSVDASAVVHARAGGAIFVVGLAVGAGKAERTRASVGIHVVAARSSIPARIGCALVHVQLTMLAAKTIDAQARVLANAVQTGAAVLAGVSGAVVRVGEAVATFVALCTKADVRAVGVLAGSAVATRRRNCTLVNVFIAEAASVSKFTGAGKVQKVARRRALGSVATFVGRAGVQFSVTIASGVRQLADALIVVNQIDAGSSVATRTRSAVINVHL